MPNWTTQETTQLVKLYRKMHDLQAAGKLGPKKSAGQVSKAVLVREFLEEQAADGRTKGSVEMKLMNVTACCEKLEQPTVKGYVAMPNCSTDLLEIVKEN